MGFFSEIRDKIFRRHHEAAISPAAPTNLEPTPTTPATPQASQPAPKLDTANQATPAQTRQVPDTSNEPVDVAMILDKAVADSGQTLHWKTSIVDLMKALDIDSSLTSRKALAKELDYKGDTDDSASMNIWLHKQVLQKLAANGGKVPAELLD